MGVGWGSFNCNLKIADAVPRVSKHAPRNFSLAGRPNAPALYGPPRPPTTSLFPPSPTDLTTSTLSMHAGSSKRMSVMASGPMPVDPIRLPTRVPARANVSAFPRSCLNASAFTRSEC